MSRSAQDHARVFARSSTRLWAIVYDNINFTLRKTSQRLDSTTQQLNATTLALFSLPKRFTRAAYQAALSIRDRNVRNGRRSELTLESLKPSEERQQQAVAGFRHAVRTILLANAPGLRRWKMFAKKLRKAAAACKPVIRVLESEKTEFFPLPALDEEESSVRGTINVVKAIFTKLLGFAAELVDVEIRLMVGDWLTIRNLCLMKMELEDELTPFATMDWVQEASMPFHFQINAVHMLFKTHVGHSSDKNNPSALESHRHILKRAKLDTKKPEYNRGRELIEHSLIAWVLDCAR
jgi:hypothetical protein